MIRITASLSSLEHPQAKTLTYTHFPAPGLRAPAPGAERP